MASKVDLASTPLSLHAHTYTNLDSQLDRLGKRQPQLRNCFHQIGLKVRLWAFSQLLTDTGGTTVVGIIPRYKKGNCKRGSKQQPP